MIDDMVLRVLDKNGKTVYKELVSTSIPPEVGALRITDTGICYKITHVGLFPGWNCFHVVAEAYEPYSGCGACGSYQK